MLHADYKAMMAALEAGAATPDQQRAAAAYITTMKRQHAQELRDADNDARDAFAQGRHEGREEERGHDYGPGIY